MAQKMVLLSLSTKCGTNIGQAVAQKLGQDFFSIDNHLEQLLSNLQPMPVKQGLKFWNDTEKHAIHDGLMSNSPVIGVSFGVFVTHMKEFKNCKLIYLYLPKTALKKFGDDDYVVNRIAFEDRNKLLEANAINIDATSLDIDLIVSEILKIIRTEI